MRADGTVDYVQAVNERASRGVTLENNAAVLLLQAFGPGELSEPEMKALCEGLRIEVPQRGDHTYRSLRQFVEEEYPHWKPDRVRRELDQIEGGNWTTAMERPWTRRDFPRLAKWIDANERALRLVHEAVARPKHYVPIVVGSRKSPRGPELLAAYPKMPVAERTLARILLTRAMLQIGEGNVPEAVRDLEAIHRLGHLLGSHSLRTIELLVAFSIDSLAVSGDRVLIAHGRLLKKQWLAYRDRLQQLSKLRTASDVVNAGTRWEVLDLIACLERDGIEAWPAIAFSGADRTGWFEKTVLKCFIHAGIDWERVSRRVNSRIDQMLAAGRIRNQNRRRERFVEIERELAAIQQKFEGWGILKQMVQRFDQEVGSRRMGDLALSQLVMPDHRLYNAEDRFHSRRIALHVGLSIAAYRADARVFPETLDALTPAYLRTIPKGIHEGREFQYKRTTEGFRLWSLGANGVDDGRPFGVPGENGGRSDDTVIQVPLYKHVPR